MVSLAKLGTTKACKSIYPFNKDFDVLDINEQTYSLRADEPLGGK